MNQIPFESMRTTAALSLTFPAMIYYIGLISLEQSVLMLSLLTVMFWNPFIQIILIAIAATFDFGNTVVVIFFVLLVRGTLLLSGLVPRKFIIFGLLALVSFALAAGSQALFAAQSIPILSDRAEAITNAMEGNEFIEKYPILLRPAITFINFVFSTPASLKVPAAYGVALISILYTAKEAISLRSKLKSDANIADYQKLSQEILMTLCGIVTILFFVFMLPTYANAKYYIFILPVFLLVPVRIFGRKKVLIISQILVYLVSLQLVLFRS